MRNHKFILNCVLLGAVSLARAETLGSIEARVAAGGEVTEVRGQRVLRLRGGDLGARGISHGYLMGREIVQALESAILSLPGFNAQKYENEFLPWTATHFVWDADADAELDAILQGMFLRLGLEERRSKTLAREFTRNDLRAMNTLADYFGPACSAFSAWGERSADGKLVHGRTLDFPIGSDAVAAQILIVSEPLPARGKDAPARKGFVAVGWPGMISQYTGMNDSGLVVCIHDGYNVAARGPTQQGCFPRGLMLRRVLEGVDPAAGDPAVAGAKMTGEFPTACGNLFHLSWPLESAKKFGIAPSAVLEFDASLKKSPAKIRRPEQEGFMVLTNHFCVLNTAVQCARCESIKGGIGMLNTAQKGIGISEARKLLMSAEQPVAAHSVYFYPDTMVFHLGLTKKNVMSPRVAPVKFTFAELFGKK